MACIIKIVPGAFKFLPAVSHLTARSIHIVLIRTIAEPARHHLAENVLTV